MEKALLYVQSDDGSVTCRLCSHYCIIRPEETGICRLRKNISGELFTLSYGKSSGFAIDPIEKKPFFHFKPGAKVLSFGTPGCNFSCLNCQNSSLSQSVRLNKISLEFEHEYSSPDVVKLAEMSNVDGIAYTYSEPTIFFEYARDIILESRKNKQTKNLFHLFISNGYFSKETSNLIKNENLLQGINIDLKFIDDKLYREVCGGRVQPVLDSIKRINDLKETIFLEVINLLIPGRNDSDEQLEKLCDFMASVNPEIPLHFNAFSPNFKLSTVPATPLTTLRRAKKTAEGKGIKFVYIGNAGRNTETNTYCPECSSLLVERNHFSVTKILIDSSAKCQNCNALIKIRI